MRAGLTGGVASGKSTVAKLLRGHGAVLIDADVLAREVLARGTPGLAAVVAEFGPGWLTEHGDLDRPAVAAVVFDDADARRRLEAIVHPLVYQRITALEAAAPEGAVVVHDIPLLVENDRAGDFDAVVVVDTPPELQLDRMVRLRGWSEGDARARMRAQADREQRLAVATHVIENSGTHEDLRDRVAEVFAALDGGRPPGVP